MVRETSTAVYQKVARQALSNRFGGVPSAIQSALDAAEPDVLEQVVLVLTSRDDDATLARVRAALGLPDE